MATLSLFQRTARWFGLGRRAVQQQVIGGNPGPQGLLSGVYPSSVGTPPLINTKSIVEGYDTMPWLRACSDKIGTALGMTDWRLYAVGAPPAAEAAAAEVPAAASYVLNPEELARAMGDAVANLVARRTREIRGQLAPWAERDRVLQRQMGAARWKRLEGLRRAGRLQEIPDHPFYDALERPNPFMDRMGLIKLTETGLDLVGDAFWLKQRNGAGVPVGYWPVPPHWVTETPTPLRPYYRVSWASWQRTIPESEVRWFHEPAPVHPYERGSGVGFALGDELEIDEYLAKMTKQMFFNDADPKWIFAGGDGTTETEMRRLERDFLNKNQGFWRKFKPYFLAGGGDDINKRIHEFQRPTMEQLVYPGLRKAQRDIVLQVYGAPPELFGITENSNRATVEAAEYLFSRWVVLPRGERLRGGLQAEVASEFDERLVLDFPSPVEEDKAYELDVRKAAPWAWTADEWRHLGGDHPMAGGKGEVHLVPSNSYTTTDLGDATQRPAAPAPPPPPPPDAPDETPKTLAEVVSRTTDATLRMAEAFTRSTAEQARATTDAFVKALPPPAPPPAAPHVETPVSVVLPDQSAGLKALGYELGTGIAAAGEALARGMAEAAAKAPPPPEQPPPPPAPPDLTPALERVGEELRTGLAAAGEAIGSSLQAAAAAAAEAARGPHSVLLVGAVPLEAAVTALPDLVTETAVTERSDKGGIAKTTARTRAKKGGK